MDKAEFDRVLQAALEEVLERMFFVDALDSGAPDPDLEAPIWARLDFDGDPGGQLRLRISRDAAVAIAADFLAEDAGALTPRQIEDVVCELTNMVCGAALSRLETGIRLQSPRILGGDDAAWQYEAPVRRLDIGNGSIAVSLHFDETPCCRNERSAS